MKIAFIIRRLNVKGGTQRQMLSLARELKKQGHRIKIYTFAYSKKDCYEDLLDDFEVITYAPQESRAPMTYYPNYVASVVREGKEAKTLARAMDRDFDLLNPHDQVAYKVAHYYKKYVKKIPSVWNMNDVPSLRWGYDKMRGVDEHFRQSLLKRALYRLFDWYDGMRFIRSQDAIVVVDDFNQYLARNYLGRDDAITVRSGPDFEHFVFLSRTPPMRSVKLLTSGILMPHRRFEDSIEAIKILLEKGYDPTLAIIGDYGHDKKYYQKLTALVGRLGIGDRVKFLGRVSEEDLLRAYHAHDIYIFQHHLQSDGLSPFEAAACGLPIIVSRTAGAHEVLTDRENGLLLEPKNPNDIAEKIKELLDDHGLYARLSKEGNDFVRRNFSWPKYAEGIMRVCANTLGRYAPSI